MKEKSLNKKLTLFAIAFLLAAALICGMFGSFSAPIKASASEGASIKPKALYFVDAGRFVQNPGEDETLSVRTGTRSYPGKKESPFMVAHDLHFGDGEGNGLYNSVTDKPSLDHDFSDGGYTYVSTFADPTTSRNWGFDYIRNGESMMIQNDQMVPGDDNQVKGPVGWDTWRTWDNEYYAGLGSPVGFETIRYVEGNSATKWEGCLTYTFEVDDDTTPLRLQFGSAGVTSNWGDQWFGVKINGGDWSSDYKVPHQNYATYNWGADIYGVKNNSDNKYYVTVEFGKSAQQPFVSYIWLFEKGYVDTYEQEAYYIQESGATTVDVLPIMAENRTANYDYYVKGTISSDSIAAINATEPFTYVNDVVYTTPDGKQITARVLALPSNTKYFINAGFDAGYAEEHGYGYISCENDNIRGYLDQPYNKSRRYTGSNDKGADGDIVYQFDNLPAGAYAVEAGANEPGWGGRTTPIEINGQAASTSLVCVNNTDTKATNYVILTDAGDLTVALLSDENSVDPVFSYIWVYAVETEAVITYDSCGGSAIAPTVRAQGDTAAVNVTTEVPTRKGYTFAGWYTTADGEEEAAASYSEAITLYAHWTAIEYAVTLNPGENGSVDPATKSVTFGQEVGELPTPAEREGFTFKGWYTEENGFGDKIESTTVWTYIESEVTTLYAYWRDDSVTYYTITFDLNGGDGTAPASQERAEGEKIAAVANPTREGYTFDGWYTAATGGEKWNFETDEVGTSNITLYAHWTQNSTGDDGPGTGGETPAKPSTSGKKKSGCGSAVATDAIVISIVLLAAASVVLVLRKKAKAN